MNARLLLCGAIVCCPVASLRAQQPASRPVPVRWQPLPTLTGRAFTVNTQALEAALLAAPAETQARAEVLLPIPLPDGSTETFRVWRVPVMAPELAARYPDIRTYAGQSVQQPAVTARFDLTPQGFHAYVLGSPAGQVVIDPADATRAAYTSRLVSQLPATPWSCAMRSGPGKQPDTATRGQAAAFGNTLLTYRLALACTGEYATAVTTNAVPAVAATKTNVLAAMVTAMNRVTGIYEKELAIRLTLIAGNDRLIYLNSATDPYTNNDGATMLDENQTNIDAIVGTGNYDIGHVFSTGGGGIAALQAVCDVNLKAQGVTGLPNPVGDAFYVDYVAHEMGHQFGGNHTFNSVTGSCGGGNRNRQTAMEPGSGTTIMAYAGICGADDIQPHSDPYFHSISQDEIRSYVLDTRANYGGACPATTITGNQPPVVAAVSAYTIPQGTPFVLTGTATDANNDALTYSWEQMNQSTQGGAPAAAATSTTAPLFRAFAPTVTGTRSFPRLSDILANSPTIGEVLSTVARTLSFRLTARDNRSGGGGVGSGTTTVTTTSAGPFLITTANTAFSQAPRSPYTLTWSVNNTNTAPISAATVRILFSTDGGQTFPHVLAASTANDGSELVTFPNVRTTTGRLRVEAVNNIFFDINNADITLTGPLPVVLTRFEATARGTSALLRWATAQELHNAGFEVQLQGPDDPEFRKVAFVAGKGTTAQPQAYQLEVPGLSAGRWYVRLHQLDDDGTGHNGTFSTVQTLVVSREPASASIWPNPLTANAGTIRVYLPTSSTVEFRLYDLRGRPVLTMPALRLEAGQTDIPLLTTGLPAGLYAWHLATGQQPGIQGRLLLVP